MHNNFSLFFKINLFFTTLLFLAFLMHNQEYTLLNFILTLLGLISSAVILYSALYLFLILFSFTKTFILYLSAIFFVIVDIGLIVDFFIYKLFHFHINAMVLNILTSPDAMDSIQTGFLPIVLFILTIIGIIYFEYITIKSVQKLQPYKKQHLNKKLNKMIILPLFLVVITEKVGFGLASLFSRNDILPSFKVIPLYQPLTFNKFASRHFGFKVEEHVKNSIKTKANIHYPLQAITLEKTDPPFNIFIIANDSVSYKMMNKETSPNITSFAKDSLVFKHHFSGGNSTRFGIFSLMYGLNATYWFSFLYASQKPVLFDVLQKLNYDISIISSTNTNWPEFRKTCYVDVQKGINDVFKGAPWQKDKQSAECFLNHIDTYHADKPLFTFIFLDAPHGFSYPPDLNIYDAAEGDINYLALTKESDELKTAIKKYKNAVHYNDMLFGQMITKLKERNLYDNSLIIYTTDHGQEFFEQGNFGHNTSFSEGQTHIPFIMKLPKVLKNLDLGKQINASLTSHQDVVPSLLSLLGVKNHPSQYSNGKNFFDSNFHRDYVFSANWNNNAIITQKDISVFSNLPNKIFNNEIRDANTYKKLNTQKSNSKLILNSINENTKFLK